MKHTCGQDSTGWSRACLHRICRGWWCAAWHRRGSQTRPDTQTRLTGCIACLCGWGDIHNLLVKNISSTINIIKCVGTLQSLHTLEMESFGTVLFLCWASYTLNKTYFKRDNCQPAYLLNQTVVDKNLFKIFFFFHFNDIRDNLEWDIHKT